MYFRGRQFLRFLYRKNKMPALFDVSVFLKKRSCIVGCIVRFSPVWFVVCSNVRITLFWSSQIQNYFTYSGFELSPRVEKKCSVLTWALMGLLWLSSNSSWVKVALQKGREKAGGETKKKETKRTLGKYLLAYLRCWISTLQNAGCPTLSVFFKY